MITRFSAYLRLLGIYVAPIEFTDTYVVPREESKFKFRLSYFMLSADQIDLLHTRLKCAKISYDMPNIPGKFDEYLDWFDAPRTVEELNNPPHNIKTDISSCATSNSADIKYQRA